GGHRQGDVPVPGAVETDLVVVQAAFALGDLEARSAQVLTSGRSHGETSTASTSLPSAASPASTTSPRPGRGAMPTTDEERG
ncbi:hypothetical protein, partial [Streptomyces sp. NPDC102437]|uniref:hypothetical protein n=1 Tax=Streptomyces sp. NPDC102437 TaxID=3366175 RepID=UPI0038259687